MWKNAKTSIAVVAALLALPFGSAVAANPVA